MSHCNCNNTNTFAEYDQYQTNYHDYLQPYSAYQDGRPPCGCMSGQSIGCGCCRQSQSGHCNHCRGVQVIGIVTLPTSTASETPPSPSPTPPPTSPPPTTPTPTSPPTSDSSQVTAVTTRLVRNPIFWGGIVVAILLLLIIVFMNR